jgi:pyruvate dehydrogenase E2 component (dihydrolipoamide acetyltransferase)
MPDKKKPVPAVPSTRRIARELGVDLTEVEPSGPGGRVTTEDVKAHAEGKDKKPEEKAEKKPDSKEKPEKPPEKKERKKPASEAPPCLISASGARWKKFPFDLSGGPLPNE